MSRNQLTKELGQELEGLELSDDWLRAIYDSRTQRFMADNDRIWSTGAIMVPLSLGGFFILATIEQPSFFKVALLAAASSGLMVVWWCIAEHHKAFQDQSLAAVDAIEGLLGLQRISPARSHSGLLSYVLLRLNISRWVRRLITVAVPLLWLWILLGGFYVQDLGEATLGQ